MSINQSNSVELTTQILNDFDKNSEILVLLSPTKTMQSADMSAINQSLIMSNPCFGAQTSELVSYLQSLSTLELVKVLQVNEKLAQQNYKRYQSFYDTPLTSAIYSYQGLQYKSLDINNGLHDSLAFIDNHFRILSGLYGVLRPLDGIVPYRLDLKSKINLPPYRNLYEFWNRHCYDNLKHQNRTLVNLASNEYSLLLDPYLNNDDDYLEIRFLVEKQGVRKQEATASKMARGFMARWIIENRITEKEKLKLFDSSGYQFDDKASNPKQFIFVRIAN